MGTRFELLLPGRDASGDLQAIGEAALAEIEDCHRRLSRFDPASLVSHLIRAGAGDPVPLDRDTFGLFRDALAVWRDSGGAFDLTLPPGSMDALQLDEPTASLRLTRPVPELDLGGIAKGHALDLAARVLREHGVRSGFLHGGTSSAIGIGAPAGAPGWPVAIAGGGSVTLRDSALSVSAVWEENPHPTRDPRTGQTITARRRVLVTGRSARLADAWSTAALVLGTAPVLGPGWQVEIRSDDHR